MINLDIHTLVLVFSLTIFLEVVILYIQYQKGKIYTGFLWWGIGIFIIGIHFLFVATLHFFPFTIAYFIIEDISLVAGSLLLFHGIVLYFRQATNNKHFLLFVGLFGISTAIPFAFGNFIIPNAISSFCVAIFSTLSAVIVLKETSSIDKTFQRIIGITFISNALFFVVEMFYWLFSPAPSLTALPTTIQVVSYFVLFFNATLWTFGFIFLMNYRLNRETIEAKEKYNLMFKTIPDAVLITRLNDGLFIEVNQGFTKLSGYTSEDVANKTTLDINIWFDPTERARFVILLTETGSIEDMEFQFRRKNGRPLLGLLSARIIQVDKEPHILSVVRDITSRKKMEEKLRENEQKYRFLTENSGDVIWHINRSLRIDYISPADENIRGFKREEVIGTQIWTIFKPEGVELVRKKISHHQEIEQIGNNNQTTRFEIEQKCKDGTWIWTEVVAAPHYDKYGNLIGYHGISRDITERKQLVDQLYQQATIDELTQVPNRRHFMNLAKIELRRAKRYHHPLSLVVIDFDDLKVINDTYGHLAGDRALSVFSKIIQEIIRDVDVLGRFGGDEFLLLLPETDAEHALLVMERIRNILASSPIFYGEKSFRVTFSAGIACIGEWTDSLEDLLNRADEALYKIKEKGGDGASTSW
jgi:diguanylate cyclase (GGDEF)-like protein/PAS domain S-box-containing protein